MRLTGSRRSLLAGTSLASSVPKGSSVYIANATGFYSITSPAFANYGTIQLWGSGAGSGAANSTVAGSGGGGGGYLIIDNTSVSPNTTYNYALYQPYYDPYAANVTMLLPFSGTVGSVPQVIEGSMSTVTLTHAGTGSGTDGYCENTVTKWGTTACYTNGGSNSASWQITPGSSLSGDFTFELFIYPMAGATNQFIFSNYLGPVCNGGGSNPAQFLFWLNNGVLTVGNPAGSFLVGGSVTYNTWHHVAWTRKSGVSSLWLDGVLQATSSAYTGTALSCYNINNPVSIKLWISGYEYTGLYQFTGYYQDMRVTSVARYTANFTVNTSSYSQIAGYSAWYGTSTSVSVAQANAGVLPGVGASGGAGGGVIGNGITYSAVGSNGTSYAGTTPGNGGNSGGGALGGIANGTANANAGANPGGGSSGQPVNGNAVVGGYPQIQVNWYSDPPPSLTPFTSNAIGYQSVTAPAGAKYASIELWGAGGNSGFANAISNSAGSGGGGGGVVISNIAVNAGQGYNFALYQAQQDPYYNKVTCLIPFTGPPINSRANPPKVIWGAMNTVTIGSAGGVNDGYIQNSVTKWGTQAGYLAGAQGSSSGYGNWWQISPVVPMTGDLTIEFWAWTASASGQQIIMGSTAGIGPADPNQVQIVRNGGGVVLTLGSASITGAALSFNTWHHYAWVRKSGVNTLYLDGVAQGTDTTFASNSVLSASTQLWLGNNQFGPALNNIYCWGGYMNDFRITKDVARYTSNFTPPTSSYAVSEGYSAFYGNVLTDTAIFQANAGQTPYVGNAGGAGGTVSGTYTIGVAGSSGTANSTTTQGSGGNSGGGALGGIGSSNATVANAGQSPGGGASGQPYAGNAVSGGSPQITITWIG